VAFFVHSPPALEIALPELRLLIGNRWVQNELADCMTVSLCSLRFDDAKISAAMHHAHQVEHAVVVALFA